jgi:hypothetical protein
MTLDRLPQGAGANRAGHYSKDSCPRPLVVRGPLLGHQFVVEDRWQPAVAFSITFSVESSSLRCEASAPRRRSPDSGG